MNENAHARGNGFAAATAPTIAVVIPTHDRADLLARALASVWSHERRPDEVVIVDDGSTDDTAGVAKIRHRAGAHRLEGVGPAADG
ncbi:MAG: glycosyltransferase family 2 protein [Gaiellaceae bacterium]